MELHYLEIFNTVAKYSSYKRASEVLNISQPALSIQIKKLEQQINAKLFYKVGNKMLLSDCGVSLYAYTTKIFAIVEEMEQNILKLSEYVGGTITLGGSNTPGTYILPNVLGQMKRDYPSVTVNLHIANTSEITTLIENGTLDIAVNGGNCIYHNSISVEKLYDDRLVVVASSMNHLCNKAVIDIEDLAKESFIVHEKTSQLYSCYKLFIEQNNIPKNISMYLGSIEAIKYAVQANLGISIMPFCAVKLEIETGLIKELAIQAFEHPYPYNLIYNKDKNNSITIQKFIEVLKKVFAQMD
ncbi:MAG: transcriptional regulator, LysR family [Firmicutes bacterium]|nr:transcriptional regulator, LysR family [Bacillota bacterium]